MYKVEGIFRAYFADGSYYQERIVASSESAAMRAVRKLAIAARPYKGSPIRCERVTTN